MFHIGRSFQDYNGQVGARTASHSLGGVMDWPAVPFNCLFDEYILLPLSIYCMRGIMTS